MTHSDRTTLTLSIKRNLKLFLGKEPREATADDMYLAVAFTVRELALEGFMATREKVKEQDPKIVCYLSMEYLIGRLLGNSLFNLGIAEPMGDAVAGLGFQLDDIVEREPDAALGNGGLGRLAACFLDTMATLGYPAIGYGLYYEFGLFRQEIDNGQQREKPDRWQRPVMPWVVERSQDRCMVPLYGRVVESVDREGRYNPMWLDWKVVIGVPHDIMVAGYGGRTVNALRLYSAEPSSDFDMQIFNSGDYIRAVEQKIRTETISKVLYPADSVRTGKELRLTQEFFFVSCALRDIVRRYQETQKDLALFPDKVAIQLNDTHPALAVPELMRILVDENDVPWDEAWGITTRTLGYTNHTLLPEALERWSVPLLEYLVPRHMQIIYEINRRFLAQACVISPWDADLPRRISLFQEGDVKEVRMAHLAIVGSHSVNGVAALHSEMIKTALAPDMFRIWPDRFNNKTNGVTPRRWLLKANPGLSRLLTAAIGEGWITDLDRLREIEPMAREIPFQHEFRRVKRENKQRLAAHIRETLRIDVDPDSVFDVQVKRIHEYKRQLMNILDVVRVYLAAAEGGIEPPVPRTYVFAGKAAPSYWLAKQIIQLIHRVADVVNGDKSLRDRIKVVFLPDYRVSLAELVIPAADLSEQISTAGTEASGTGNMKLAMNGALTIGTLDGANIEIAGAVGAENLFIFGKKAPEIEQLRRVNAYNAARELARNENMLRVLSALSSGRFGGEGSGPFDWVRRTLIDEGDRYFVLADIDAYAEARERAFAEYLDPGSWTRKGILNVARVGPFSSDRTIREYASEIWNVAPLR